jgi:hypothetical protein
MLLIVCVRTDHVIFLWGFYIRDLELLKVALVLHQTFNTGQTRHGYLSMGHRQNWKIVAQIL